MRWKVGVTVLLMSALSSEARASHGGPELTDALGWDPVDRKAFFTIQPHDESGRLARVVYFTAEGPPLGYVVSWSRVGFEDTKDYTKRLESLKRRLRPLHPVHGPTIPLQRSIVGVDTIGPWDMRWPRFRIHARDHHLFGGTLAATTIVDPDVRVIRRYSVPGWSRALGIVSFRGVPAEIGYEAQVPVLLPEKGDTLRVGWKRLP